MNSIPYYRLELDNASSAAFTSFGKYYFGTMADIQGFIEAIEQEKELKGPYTNLIYPLSGLIKVVRQRYCTQ